MYSVHSNETAASVSNKTDVTFRVDDMTCGHCAGTIKSAIEKGISGVRVHADPESRSVSVAGTADRARVAELITGAGYTPQAAA